MSLFIPKDGACKSNVYVEFYTVEESKEARRVIIFYNLIYFTFNLATCREKVYG